MDRNYFKEYYHYERNHWWFKVRNQILMQQVNRFIKKNNINNPKILNVGVATGKSTEDLSELGKVTSLEYDKECCEFLKSELGMEVINGSVLELPFSNNSFDVVCAFDVIEHVEDDVKAVQELERVSKNGIIVSVPMFMALWSDHDVINHHFRRYTLKKLRKLFIRSCGKGRIIKVTYFNTILYPAILAFRIIERRFKSKKREVKSDFSKSGNPYIGKLFYYMFLIEFYLIKIIRLPFGVSGVLTWKKES